MRAKRTLALGSLLVVVTACEGLTGATATPTSAPPAPSPTIVTATPTSRSSPLLTTPSPALPAVCAASATLRAAVQALRDVSLQEDGVLSLRQSIDGVTTATRDLAESASEELRPLVEGLQASIGGLRPILDELGDQPTLGARVAAIRTAIVDIGEAADALQGRLQTPCPTMPTSSPATSPSPA